MNVFDEGIYIALRKQKGSSHVYIEFGFNRNLPT